MEDTRPLDALTSGRKGKARDAAVGAGSAKPETEPRFLRARLTAAAQGLTAAPGFTSADHHAKQSRPHWALLPNRGGSSRRRQLEPPLCFSCRLGDGCCLKGKLIYSFIHISGNTWNQSERIKNTSSETDRCVLGLLSCRMKKHCPYLLSAFTSFAGSKCSVILCFPRLIRRRTQLIKLLTV